MFSRILVVVWVLFMVPTLSNAQERVWVQIEAQPSLLEAETRARAYADRLDFVNAFSLGAGWYAIALGPYSRDEADAVRRQLRNSGDVPSDSFVSVGGQYGQQIWPIGGALAGPITQVETPARVDVVIDTVTDTDTDTPQVTTIREQIAAADETPQEARASESRLSRDKKQELQIALKWAGFYDSTIDGSFGRGTRTSMQLWQEANGFEGTGILTTAQRSVLFDQYNAVLQGLDLTLVSNRDAGIELQLPLGIVQFAKNEAPLVHYDATDGSIAKVLLLSQTGDDFTLRAIYEALQSIDIIPSTGDRIVSDRGFEIVGENSERVSYASAELSNGEIKGFVLVWPANDEERRSRLLQEMRNSFVSLDGTLNPNMSAGTIEELDQVYGLDIRQPDFSHAGIYVSQSGLTLTQSVGLDTCTKITLEGDQDATLVSVDIATGLALVKPKDAIAPLAVAKFAPQATTAGLRQSIVVAGYPYNGRLGVPSAAMGTVAELRDLSGNDQRMRLDVSVESGDMGGPVLNMAGHVIGAISHQSVDRILPQDVAFAVKSNVLTEFLQQASINYQTAPDQTDLDPLYVTQSARDITALVNCWK